MISGRKRKAALGAAALLLVLAAASCGRRPATTAKPRAAKPRAAKPTTAPVPAKIAWGEAVDGLQYRISTAEVAFSRNSASVTLTVEARNAGAKPVELTRPGYHSRECKVYDSAGREVIPELHCAKKHVLRQAQLREMIEPGKIVSYLEYLATYGCLRYPFSAGTYTLQYRGSNVLRVTFGAPATARPKAAKPPVTPKIAWGRTVKGLRMGLSVEGRKFTLGAPIPVSVHVQNLGQEDAVLVKGRVWDGWHFAFARGGRHSSFTTSFRADAGGKRLERLTIAKGETVTLKVPVGSPTGGRWTWKVKQDFGAFDAKNNPLRPGRYKLIAKYSTLPGYDPKRVADAWDGWLRASVRGIEIVAPAPAKALTETAARALATKLANAELAKGGVRDINERPIPADLRPESWNTVVRLEGRWTLILGGPGGGTQAYVTFNLDGTEPRVEVGYSSR